MYVYMFLQTVQVLCKYVLYILKHTKKNRRLKRVGEKIVNGKIKYFPPYLWFS